MPYIHPILGVPVMTTSEFWAEEGERLGRHPIDLANEHYFELEKEDMRASQAIMRDTVGALEKLKSYYDPEYCDDLTFLPLEVLEIIDARVHSGMKKATTTFVAVVNCSDGKVRTLEYTECDYYGSYMEPPEFDCSCQEVTDR